MRRAPGFRRSGRRFQRTRRLSSPGPSASRLLRIRRLKLRGARLQHTERQRHDRALRVGTKRHSNERMLGHSTRAEFIYRHKWRVNDLIFWDNRCAMHYALADHDFSVRRRVDRTTVAGDLPY